MQSSTQNNPVFNAGSNGLDFSQRFYHFMSSNYLLCSSSFEGIKF